MGKTIDRLKKQLKKSEYKKETQDCIKIYNWLKNTDKDGQVWNNKWPALVDIKFRGILDDEKVYLPNTIGYTLLKGIEYQAFLLALKD